MGVRLGYGYGYYDRFLSSTDAVKISLTYSKQIVKSIPSDSHDIKIDWIVTEDENISTVFLNGEIDMDIADNVREVIFPLIDSGKEVHLNMKDVQYMDSSGISVIVESNQRAKEKNTKVELKEVSQPVEKVLAMARKFL